MATNAQLQALWIQAGGDPTKAGVAAAIALAESGGVASATHTNSNGSIDRGLWQINSVHGAQSTTDPLANARAAVAISNNGRSFQPWTTFNSGAYRKFLDGSGGTADSGAAQGDASSGGGNWVADLFAPIFGTLGNWALDAGMIVGGLLVFVWGTTITILSTDKGKQTGKAVAGGVLTVATGGSVKAATVAAAASGIASKRSKDAAARAKSAQEVGPRNRKVIDGASEQKKQTDKARTSRQRMES